MDTRKKERFKLILQENNGRITKICRYYCNNNQDREDLHQEVLVNIWKSLDNFRGDSTLSTWIYRIAVNTSISFSGKTCRNKQLFIDKAPENLHFLFEEDDLEQKFQIEEQLKALENSINQLSVIDKILISLVLEKLSLREIGEIVGLTEANVKVKIHRIKEQLRHLLKINQL